jgi:hypothetical protein
MVAYATITCPAAQASLGTAFQDAQWLPETLFRRLAAWSEPVWKNWGWTCPTLVPRGSNVSAATAGTVSVAAVLTLICSIVASWRPAWIPRLLPSLGLIAAAVLVIAFLRSLDKAEGDLWPLLLGGAAFFYLWWLATLLFDLTFVWKRFVRGAAVTDAMRRIVMEGYKPSITDRVMSAVSKRARR